MQQILPVTERKLPRWLLTRNVTPRSIACLKTHDSLSFSLYPSWAKVRDAC